MHEDVTRGKVVIKVYKLVRGVWSTNPVKQVERSIGTRGGYAWLWTPGAKGKYRLEVTFPGAGQVDTLHAPGAAPARYLRIY